MPPLVMFDLDQTLAESKQPLTPQMAELVAKLLARTKVAIISGGALPQFLKQVVMQLPPRAKLENLYLLPTSGAALYTWKEGSWQKIYEELLSPTGAAEIKAAMMQAIKTTGVIDRSTPAYGERIEYRGSQMSLSALGQQAPINEKKAWDPDKSKRRALQQAIAALLPHYAVGMGGATTIDITKKGIDKGYGIRQLARYLALPLGEIVYVGDELEPGGNDEAALSAGVKTHPVRDPTDTAFYLAQILHAP